MLTETEKQAIEKEAFEYIPEGDPLYQEPSYYHERCVEKAYIAGATAYAEKLKAANERCEKLVEALTHISVYNGGFVEYYRGHDYRNMYALWQVVNDTIKQALSDHVKEVTNGNS